MRPVIIGHREAAVALDPLGRAWEFSSPLSALKLYTAWDSTGNYSRTATLLNSTVVLEKCGQVYSSDQF